MSLYSTKSIDFTEIDASVTKNITLSLSIARFDQIHPIVSGNKVFKLNHFIAKAIEEKKEILTFGGPYSNHLLATAFACKEANVGCVAILKGDKHPNTQTLEDCAALGMKFSFVDRKTYQRVAQRTAEPIDKIIVPEGGFHPSGAIGAAAMMDHINQQNFTHIVVAVGTATTLAGILLNNPHQKRIIAVPSIKGMDDIETRIRQLIGPQNLEHLEIWPEYHFGGYAKHPQALLNFINEFFAATAVPLDIIYTAKAVFGLMDKIKSDFFAPGSKICFMHTGGLQGNRSLAPNTLAF